MCCSAIRYKISVTPQRVPASPTTSIQFSPQGSSLHVAFHERELDLDWKTFIIFLFSLVFLLTLTSGIGTSLWCLFYSEYQLNLLSHELLLPIPQSWSQWEPFVVQPHTTEPRQTLGTAWFSKSPVVQCRYILFQMSVTEGGLYHPNFTYIHTHSFWHT